MSWLLKHFYNKNNEKREKEENKELSNSEHPTYSISEHILGLNVPTLELDSEREEEMIKFIADKIKRYGMKAPALLMLIPLTRVGPVFSQTYILMMAPWLEAFGLRGYDVTAFFNKTERVERLVNKIREDI